MSNSPSEHFDSPIPPSHLLEADIVFESQESYDDYLGSIYASANMFGGTLLEFDVTQEGCEYHVGAVYVGFSSPKEYKEFLASVDALGVSDITVIEQGHIKLQDIQDMDGAQLAQKRSQFYNPDMYV